MAARTTDKERKQRMDELDRREAEVGRALDGAVRRAAGLGASSREMARRLKAFRLNGHASGLHEEAEQERKEDGHDDDDEGRPGAERGPAAEDPRA